MLSRRATDARDRRASGRLEPEPEWVAGGSAPWYSRARSAPGRRIAGGTTAADTNAGDRPIAAGSGTSTSWYALHTRSRHERRVDVRLRERGLESYLPLAPRESRWHDRTKIVEWPLFPGYVFVRAPAARLVEAASVAGVAGVVRAAGRPAAIPEDEIDTVREVVAILLADGKVPEAGPLLRVGEVVRVRWGPFAGVCGRVVERRGDRAAIQIGLEAIARGVRLDLAAVDLEPAGAGAADGRAARRAEDGRAARRAEDGDG